MKSEFSEIWYQRTTADTKLKISSISENSKNSNVIKRQCQFKVFTQTFGDKVLTKNYFEKYFYYLNNILVTMIIVTNHMQV